MKQGENGKATRWKKGQSGNISGRPKSPLSEAAIKKIALEYLSQPDPDDPTGQIRIVKVLAATYESAIGKKTGIGSARAQGELLDRALGKAAQALTVNGNLNLTPEQRRASIEELLKDLPQPKDADGPGNPRIN